MVRMAASRPMGLIRGISKVNGLGKHKDRSSKHNGSTWQEWQPTSSWD